MLLDAKTTNSEVVLSDLDLSLISWELQPVPLIEGFELRLHNESEAAVAHESGRRC